jgi:hypothetical protein
MNIEIHRADPQLRRLTLVVLASAMLAAILLMAWFHHWLDRSTVAMPTERFMLEMHRMIGITSTASSLCLLLLAACAARLGRRVIAARRWPLQGSRVVLDMRIRTGDEAAAFGRVLNIVAVVLVVLAIAFGVLGWRLVGPG